MSGLSPEEYRILFNKFYEAAESVLPPGVDDAKRLFAVCFAEISSWSKHLNDTIEKIAESNPNLSERDLDELLGNLVNAKIYMYDELRCWMRKLRRPLQKVAEAVEEKLYELEGEHDQQEGSTD